MAAFAWARKAGLASWPTMSPEAAMSARVVASSINSGDSATRKSTGQYIDWFSSWVNAV